MSDRIMPICIPLPELSPEYAAELVEFLYEFAGRVEGSYYDILQQHYRRQTLQSDLDYFDTLLGKKPAPKQLELFDDLDFF